MVLGHHVHQRQTAFRSRGHERVAAPGVVCTVAKARLTTRRETRCGASSVQAREAEATNVRHGSWCNPKSAVIRQIQEGLWVAERPFVWNGIDVGGRMTVIKVADGTLWVHSPVHLDSMLQASLNAIGPVGHIVVPNYEHTKFAQQWIEAFPDAASYGCPGLQDVHPDITVSNTIGEGNTAPEGWPPEIQVTHLPFERNPFNGKSFFSEVLFCHVPTGTLLTTDFYWNYPSSVPAGTRLWKFGMDRVYHWFYFNHMIKDKDAYRAAISRVFSQKWDTLLPCHGNIVFANGRKELRRFVIND